MKPKHPRGLAVLFATEMAERYSFYTMRSLLVLYLIEHFGLSDRLAGLIYAFFMGSSWFLPFFGGLLADRVLGIMKTVFWGGVVFFFGHLLLGLTDFVPAAGKDASFWSAPSFWVFALGLCTVACGNGLFKGNISVLVGNLYESEERKPLRDNGFQIFYTGINIGAFVAPIAAPWLQHRFGWGVAFGSAAAGILLSFAVFYLGRKHLVDKPPIRRTAEQPRQPLTPKQKQQLRAVFFVLVISGLFWSVYWQDANAMTLFASRHVDLDQWGLDAPTFLSFNPLYIFIFTPFFIGVWSFLRKRGKEPSTPGKMAFGLFFMGAAMLIMRFAAGIIESSPAGAKVSPFFMAGTYILYTWGELWLSPIGLSFCTKYAPPGYSGLLMGCWFASLGTGSYLTGIYGYLGLSLTGLYSVLAGVMIVGAVILMLMLPKLKSLLD